MLSPKEILLPPIWFSIIGIHVDQEFPALFPDKQEHRKSEAGNPQDKEVKGPASENSIDSGHVQQENKEDGFCEDSEEHVLVEARVNQ